MELFLEKARNRVSIRKFKNEKVNDDVKNDIFDAMLNTATSNFAQQASIIYVTSDEKKKQISLVSKQDYIADVPEMLIFIADHHKNIGLFKEYGHSLDERPSDVDVFFQGFTDAALMAQTAANIMESMGLGNVFLGSILNDAQQIIDILELPEYTFPVVGLAFGYPDQQPDLKPKMDKTLRIFENSYKKQDSYINFMGDYNDITREYYAQRGDKEGNDFFKHIVGSYGKSPAFRNELLNVARKNGYKL